MNHYTYKITNIKTNEFYVGVRSCKCAIAQSFRDAACGKRSFYKHYLIRAATDSDISRKSGKNGETLEVDNPVGSLGSV